jgi:23S rRNA pseudoU1915 N3-methylase RlmH
MARTKNKTDELPKDYDALFIEIINDIAENGQSLRDAVKNRMAASKFYEMLKDDKEKEKLYARACESRAEVIADEIMEISDNVGGDVMILADGRQVVDNAVVQRDRLRVDTRKWLLAKLHPKKYGDHLDVEHSGGITLHFDKDDAGA